MCPERVDMCAFLIRNDELTDLGQCAKLDTSEIRAHIPFNAPVCVHIEVDYDLDEQISEGFLRIMGFGEETKDGV